MRAIQFIPYLLIILLAFFLISFPFMPHLDHLAMNQIHTKSHLTISNEISYSMYGADLHDFCKSDPTHICLSFLIIFPIEIVFTSGLFSCLV